MVFNNETSCNIFTSTMSDMKWTNIKQYADENAIVLLPLGVMEEHGPQLCIATDIYTSHIYSIAVKDKLEEKGYKAVIAPPFYWGICQSARGFVGSFNIRLETAQALLFDILHSLCDFGFKQIFAINSHGDVEHKIVAMNAFKEAWEKFQITACIPFDDFMLHHLGLESSEPWFYSIKPQDIKVSEARVSDVHTGDIETAMIHTYYPQSVDTKIAKSLPDVALPEDKYADWMFGGQLKQFSSLGYLGSPSSYESVDIAKNVEDYANRITEAIITRIGYDGGNK